MKTLNVFIANWNSYYQLNDFINHLAAHGTRVNLFTYNVDNISEASFKNEKIILFQYRRKKNFFHRLLFKLQLEPLIQFNVILRIFRLIILNRDSFTGNILCVEKGGVVLYSYFKYFFPSENKKFYWSLELYTNTNESVFRHIYKLKRAFKIEKKNLRTFNFILIQDTFRFAQLWYAKHLIPIYLPVTTSRTEQSFSEKKNDLLYFGIIRRERGILEFLNLLNNKNFSIQLNGPINLDFKREILNSKFKMPIEISFYDDFSKIFLNSRIGIVWYNSESINDSLTGKSSEKISRYLSNGMPFITNQNNSSYLHLIELEVCYFVNELNIQSTIKNILENYQKISQKAILAHSKYYSSEFYFSQLTGKLTS